MPATSNDYRYETDSMGQMKVPAGCYYGAQTARAVENFQISNLRFPRSFIRALGLIKKHAAATNAALGLLPEAIARPVQHAAAEVIEGKFDAEFVVDIFQTGSGTSTNMNANEVIANRAIELSGGQRGNKTIHPNDHVNRGQSSNDVIPTAIHIAALEEMEALLFPGLRRLHAALATKGREFDPILKIGRTHLQDATPIRLGQEFSGYARLIEQAIANLEEGRHLLEEVALGGTAVGTGINTHPEFAARTLAGISHETGLSLGEARNHFAAQGAAQACVEISGRLKTLAVSLIKITNDIRWLGSGPRCGLGEIKLPTVQPGSSIMPGKVNPVMAEMLIQVSVHVIGSDASITLGGTQGAFELNTMLPLIAYHVLHSIEFIGKGAIAFADLCVQGLEADRSRCESSVEQSLAMCTSLAPVIGYEQAARIAKLAYQTGRTVREVAREESGLPEDQLRQLLDPRRQTGGE